MADPLSLEERVALAIRIGESQYREFKSAWHGAPGSKSARPISEICVDISRTLVAFANADGGELLVGVEDEGTVTGVPHNETKIQQLLDAPKSHVHADTPLPTVRKFSQAINGLRVLYFSVPKGTSYIHLTADGRCLRRVDRDSVPVSVEHIQSGRLEDASRAWDREIVPAATLEDLSIEKVAAVAARLAYGVSPEKCLQYLDLAEFGIDGLRLKRAALLLFAKDIRRWHSGCYLRILTINGTERLVGEDYNVAKDDRLEDSLLDLVDMGWQRLVYALANQTILTQRGRFEQALEYPQTACREALINAVVHRNYAIEGRGIEISIYQDRMEILSPGMLLSTISLDEIRSQSGAHESRNPNVARVMRELGLIREQGEGIRRIFEAMRRSSLAEPQFESGLQGFMVRYLNKSRYAPEVRLWLSNFEDHHLNEQQLAILSLGYKEREFSTQDIIDRLGLVDVDKVRELMTTLRQKGLVVRTMHKRAVYRKAKDLGITKRELPAWRVAVSGLAVSGQVTSLVRSTDDGNNSLNAPKRGVAAEMLTEETETPRARANLYLGNLDYSVTKTQLLSFLSPYFEVVAVDVLPARDRSGNRGYGFVEVKVSPTDANVLSQQIENCQGSLLLGRPIRISRAHDR